MQTMNQSLARLVEKRVITRDIGAGHLVAPRRTASRCSNAAWPRPGAGAPGLAQRRTPMAQGVTMTTYAWVGRTRNGQIVKGERAAESTDALTDALRREQILVTKISAAAKKEERYRRVSAAQPRDLHAAVLGHDRRRPAARAVSRAAGQGRAGQAPGGGHRRRSRRTSKPARRWPTPCRSGRTPSTRSSRNMVAAGEAGGILDTILQRLSTFIEKQAKLVSQVRSAMIYPIAVLSIAAIVVIVILVKVVPTFTALFEGLSAELPLPTRVVIWISKKTHRRAAVPRSAACFGARTCSGGTTQTPAAGMRVDAIAAAAAAARHDLPEGRRGAVLPHAGHAAELRRADPRRPRHHGEDVGQRHHREARSRRCAAASSAARPSPRRCARPASSRRWWSQMIGAGESTGALDTMLAKIADFYEDEVDVAVAGLLTILEPRADLRPRRHRRRHRHLDVSAAVRPDQPAVVRRRQKCRRADRP